MGEGQIRNSDRDRGLSRRDLIKRGAIMGGVAVWGVPLIKMAMTDDLPTQSLGGATLVVFPGTCEATLLEDPEHTRFVCARNASGAVTAFKTAVKTACTPKCAESTNCAPGTGTCRTNKRTPTTVGTVTCTETFNPSGCPEGSYARGSKEFLCVGVVTCNCVCR